MQILVFSFHINHISFLIYFNENFTFTQKGEREIPYIFKSLEVVISLAHIQRVRKYTWQCKIFHDQNTKG